MIENIPLNYLIIALCLAIIFSIYLLYKKIDNKNDLKKDLGIEREIRDGLGQLTNRLKAIDEKQKELGNVKEIVIDFKNLFNNKTERGKLGEEYLEGIIQDTLQKKHYKFQHTLSNNKRVDCFLTLGSSNESFAIDSKLSWENYKKMQEASDTNSRNGYAKEFSVDINKHINDVSEKYIITGETAPIALMFVASEGVFRAIEDSSHNFIKKARAKNVVILSPNTLWSFLRTYKLLIQNKEMYEKSHILQKEVTSLTKDVSLLVDRFFSIGDKQDKITEDFRKLKISVDKIQTRSERIKNLDLDQKEKVENKK
tara:strand:- start:1393 stop:2328 length:936 start_codon:yes stop_codon:yes gene_type:complete